MVNKMHQGSGAPICWQTMEPGVCSIDLVYYKSCIRYMNFRIEEFNLKI